MQSDTGHPVSTIRKTDTAEVRVSRSLWKGRNVVDIRIWYLPTGGAELVPTRKGLTIDAGKLSDLIEALKEVA